MSPTGNFTQIITTSFLQAGWPSRPQPRISLEELTDSCTSTVMIFVIIAWLVRNELMYFDARCNQTISEQLNLIT